MGMIWTSYKIMMGMMAWCNDLERVVSCLRRTYNWIVFMIGTWWWGDIRMEYLLTLLWLSSLHHRFFFFSPKREQRTFIWFYYFIGSPGSHVMEPRRSPFLVIIYFHINLMEKPWRWKVCFWYPNCYKINTIKIQERWMQRVGGKAKLLGSGPELWLEEAVFCLIDNSCCVHDCA